MIKHNGTIYTQHMYKIIKKNFNDLVIRYKYKILMCNTVDSSTIRFKLSSNSEKV